MADSPVAKWLLYQKDSPVLDFLTNDSNLKAAQNFFMGVAIVAGSIATGGMVAEYAVATWGVSAGTASLIGGGAAGAYGTTANTAVFENRLPSVPELAQGTLEGAAMGGGMHIVETKLIPPLVNLTLPKSSPVTTTTPVAPTPVVVDPPPQVPEITMDYAGKLQNNPSDANFLRLNAEWAQTDAPLVRGERLDADAALRGAARRNMIKNGYDLTGKSAMHPLDSCANPFLGDGAGTTYYFGDSGVNSSFGSRLGNALDAAGVPVGGQFRLRFTNFPSYDVAPPMAPPASPPDLALRYKYFPSNSGGSQ
jgi:hypothetical protein